MNSEYAAAAVPAVVAAERWTVVVVDHGHCDYPEISRALDAEEARPGPRRLPQRMSGECVEVIPGV